MNKKSFKQELLIDFLQMLALFVASVFAVYKTSPTIRDLFFLIVLFFAFRSKKDYFWFAFFFILINSPIGFFMNRTQDAIFRLPFYRIIPQFSLTPMDIFLFISIFKAMKADVKVKFKLNKPLEFFLFYLIFVSIPVSWFLGTELKPFVNTLRSFFFFGIIFSYLRLIKNKDEIIKFGYLIFPFIILIVADQLYLIKMESGLLFFFDPSREGVFVKNSISGDIRAVVSGILIVFYTLIFGFQINGDKKYELFPNFSFLAIALPIASFFLSATRSWMMIGAMILFVFVIISPLGLKFVMRFGTFAVVAVMLLLASGFIEKEFIDNINERYSVLGKMASSGNLRQGTFQDRIDNDIPKVIKGMSYSPVLGVGMSEYMKKYYSNDVGFMNTLLIYGIVGFPIFVFFLIRYVVLLNRYRKSDNFDFTEKNIFISLILGFTGILVGYFATWDFFSFYPEKVYFVSIIFATGDLVLELNSRNTNELAA